VVAVFGNSLEAKAVLQQQKIDLIFLDINMPLLDGNAFLKTLRNQPQIIFTTAYKEYGHPLLSPALKTFFLNYNFFVFTFHLSLISQELHTSKGIGFSLIILSYRLVAITGKSF
jgi:response regulator of citrate/malate metabolism